MIVAPLLVDPDDLVAAGRVLVGDLRHDRLAAAHEPEDEVAHAQDEQHRHDDDDAECHADLPLDPLPPLA